MPQDEFTRIHQESSQEQFVKFYQEWLPTRPELERQLNNIGNDPADFAATAVKLGTPNGFEFDESDVVKVMTASQAKFMESQRPSAEDLAEQDARLKAARQIIAAISKGPSPASSFTISISKIASPLTTVGNLKVKVSDYGMCCW